MVIRGQSLPGPSVAAPSPALLPHASGLSEGMTWIDCGPDHLEAIRAIFNEAIANSTALYEYAPRSAAMMTTWFAAKQAGEYPVIGLLDPAGTLAGFASYGPFRAYPAYKYTVEHSVYVDARFRGQGLGRRLLERLVDRAQAQGYHSMIGVIDADNAMSVALHERLGFELCGRIPEAGFKFGRWLDLVLYQRRLPTPLQPMDG